MSSSMPLSVLLPAVYDYYCCTTTVYVCKLLELIFELLVRTVVVVRRGMYGIASYIRYGINSSIIVFLAQVDC